MGGRLRARLRVVRRQAGAPLGIAHDRGSKLRIGWKVGIVGRAAEEGHERQTLLGRNREVTVAGKHVLVAAAPLGVRGGPAHHLNPPVGHVGTVLVAHAPAKHCRDLWSLPFDQVIEPVQPPRERLPAAGPLIDRGGLVCHCPDAIGSPQSRRPARPRS